MRVTDHLRYEGFKNTLTTLQQQINRNQQMTASNKKILAPSDDPVISSRVVEFDAERQRAGQYKRNLERLQTTGAFYETSVNTVSDLLTEAKQLAVSGSSANVNADGRATMADEIDGILDQLVSIGNTKVGNTYIFGGKNSNAVPFSMLPDGTVVRGANTDVVTKVAVDSSTTLNVGISGKAMFENDAGVNIFEVIRDLRDDLAANDVSGIQAAVNDLDDCVTLTTRNLSYIGNYTKRIESLLGVNSTRDTTLQETTANMIEADAVQLIADYNTLTTAYQSAIYSMSKLQDLSILNYL